MGIVRRLSWMAVLVVALAFAGCSGGKTDEESLEVPVSTSGEEDAYKTAVFAQQRAEWETHAEQGDAKAQRQLGMMYYLGQGMDADFESAYGWLSKASAQGDDIAQLTMGVMHVEGQGVPQSNVTAHMWFSLSAQQGNPSALYRLEQLVEAMGSEEISEAEELADNWPPSS